MDRRLFFFVVVLTGCGDCDHDSQSAAVDASKDAKRVAIAVVDAAASARAPLPPLRGHPRVAADGERVLVASLEVADPPAPAAVQDWVRVTSARWTRAKITGDPDDLVRALAAVDAMIALDPRVAAHHVTRAEVLAALRRNVDAEKEQKQAVELGAQGVGVDLVTATIDWEAGRYGAAIDRLRAAARPDALAAAYLRLGVLESDLGNLDDSERAFENGEDRVAREDVVPLASIYVARGAARLRRGKPDEAEPFLRAALARVPEHTIAAGFLAESLAKQGKQDAAFAAVEPLLDKTRDPSLLAAAARVAPAAKVATIRARSRARFEQLLASAPDAIGAAAGDAFLEWGDTKRSSTLFAHEAEARPTARSFEAVARVALAAGDAAAARTAIERALHSPMRDARIDWTAARVYARLGDASKSGELTARARRLNPRISDDEPPVTTTK